MRSRLLLLPLLAACYTYAPLDVGAARPGAGVRARISATYAEQLEPLLGLHDARLINGRLIDIRGDTLIVEVATTARSDASGGVQTFNQRVSIPRSAILEFERRTLDKTRTTIVVGGATALLGALIVRTLVQDPGKEAIPGGGGAEVRLP